MRRTEILIVSLVAFGLSAAPAAAEAQADPTAAQARTAEAAPAPAPSDAPAEPVATAAVPAEAEASAPATGTIDAPAVVAAQPASSVSAETGEAVRVVSGSKTIVLGPQGVDDQGRVGRLHTVSRGDTLWDLSAAYLGTPWVWPSVWTDNHDIANPHLIRPGDRIWITANEMRVVSDDEADAFLERLLEESAGSDATADATAEPAAPAMEEEPMEEMAEAPAEEPVLAAVPDPTPTGRQITVSTRAAMGFLTEEQLAGASSIVDSPSERTNMVEGDVVYLGLGEGDTQVGDRFTIFEAVEIVREVGSNRILGHHVDVLGWVEVRQLTGDTSVGVIRMSYSEIQRGARILARPPTPRQVTVLRTPDAREGNIVFLPSSRTVMADGGYVYLNRGELDGLEVGSELEVVGRGGIRHDASRAIDVQTPDHRVGTLVVVSVEPNTAVAFVLNSARELEVGDTVRPMAARLASR